MAKKKVQVFEFEGKKITFDFGDGQKMVNATQMAKSFNKKLDNFSRLKQTKEFISVLESVPSDVREREIVKVVRGGVPALQGTWYCDILALKLAAWLSPEFEVWVYDKILELLTTGKTEIKKSGKDSLSKDTLVWYLEKIATDSQEAMNLTDYLIKELKK